MIRGRPGGLFQFCGGGAVRIINKTVLQQVPPVLDRECRRTQVDPYNGIMAIKRLCVYKVDGANVRYVRHLDSTIHAIQIKTKVCQLVEAMMMRRDDLTFRQEMKFRNKLVEYLTDWIMGNSHQLNVQGDVFSMSRYCREHAVTF